jgi:YVTN family beta-propeller protein
MVKELRNLIIKKRNLMLKKLCIATLSILLLPPALSYAVPANTVIATIPVGLNPGGIAITPNGKFAYIANNNNYTLQNTNSSGATVNTDSVSVIDLSNNSVLKTIYDPSFMQPYTVTINAAGTLAYITNSTGQTISIIDIATNTVIGTIGGFDGPSGMVITPDGNTAYVNNYGATPGAGSGNATTVRVVNLNTNMITGPAITVGLAPAALAITPDGKFVYVADYQTGTPNDGTITVINTSTNTATLNVVTGLFGPFAISITPDGSYAYVTNFGSNNFSPFGTTLSKIDLQTNTIVATHTLSIQPSGLAISPDGRYVYASNYNTLYMDLYNFSGLTAGQGIVNIIDTVTNNILPISIAVDQSPDAIAITPNGFYAYVTNYTSNTVSVIALQTFQITAQGCKTANRYLAQTDFLNKLTWTATGFSLPVSYSIYRDSALMSLIGTVSANQPLVFYDHNTNPNATYTYYIVGTNSVGTVSTPIAVTVTEHC